MTPPDIGGWPPIVGLVGPKNSGKTTLLEGMLPVWREGRLRVGAVKHTHHPLRVGDPRSDSERLRLAGAAAVVACGVDTPWSDAVGRLLSAAPVLDFILCEGYHAAPVVQVAVLPDPGTLASERARSRGWLVAAVVPDPSAGQIADPHIAWWARDDVRGLAAWIADGCRPVGGTAAKVAAAVLAGGASRRMGADKAALLWQGSTWLDRVRRAAEAATGGSTMIVGGAGSEPWRVPDLLPGHGPLAALASAWYRTRAPWVLLCACDMPMLDGAALGVLLEHVPGAGEAVAVIPVIGGRRQYTSALYARRAWPSAVAALGSGTRGLRAWVDGLSVQAVHEVGEQAWRQRGMDPAAAFADFDDAAALAPWKREVDPPKAPPPPSPPPRTH